MKISGSVQITSLISIARFNVCGKLNEIMVF